jgi:hypothetical protein
MLVQLRLAAGPFALSHGAASARTRQCRTAGQHEPAARHCVVRRWFAKATICGGGLGRSIGGQVVVPDRGNDGRDIDDPSDAGG